MRKSKRLKKELSLFKIYAVATGATLSSGFFLLPGLAAGQAGPAVIVSYLLAALHLLPAVFCMAELATAMPRSGGIYYFVDRSMGPLLGTIAGIGTWLALILKTAFALVGMGAYITLFFPDTPMAPLAIGLAIVFGWLNLFGVKKSGGFQVILVVVLLTILGSFMGFGLFQLQASHFRDFFARSFDSIYATAGLVYISYVGLTKIASVSEEVSNPERNLPLAMFLALGTAILIYTVGTTVMVGVIPLDVLKHNLTPVAAAAEVLFGEVGRVTLTVAAVLAFFSVSNAGILSASRYPLAMSRDHLMPRYFRYLSKYRTPKVSIYVTVGLIILCIVAFDPTKIAKLAGAFQLLLFGLSCLAVIIMRESGLEAYDPGYKSPLYPWMQLAGLIAPMFLIAEMGWMPALFTTGLIALGTGWYMYYGRKRITRDGAIYHYFARLGKRRFEGLERELRGIMKEKGARQEDPFDMVIARAVFVDLPDCRSFQTVVESASEKLAKRIPASVELFQESFLEGTRVGATPVSNGVALPHMRLPDLKHPEVAIVRTASGINVDIDDEFLGDHATVQPVYAFFFLVSPEENPGQHLRLLAQIADQVDDDEFIGNLLRAPDEVALKELLLREEHAIALHLNKTGRTAEMIGKAVRDLSMPEGSLIAIIHRNGRIIIPRGRTVLRENDRLTIIAEPKVISKLNKEYDREASPLADS